MLGDFDIDELMGSENGNNRELGPFLTISFVIFMFFIVLSMFLAIVDTSYEKVREQLERKAHEPKHQFLEDFSWLCTLPSRAVGAVWAKFIRCLWDAEKLNPLQEEEDEETGGRKEDTPTLRVAELSRGEEGGVAQEQRARARAEREKEGSDVLLQGPDPGPESRGAAAPGRGRRSGRAAPAARR